MLMVSFSFLRGEKVWSNLLYVLLGLGFGFGSVSKVTTQRTRANKRSCVKMGAVSHPHILRPTTALPPWFSHA